MNAEAITVCVADIKHRGRDVSDELKIPVKIKKKQQQCFLAEPSVK